MKNEDILKSYIKNVGNVINFPKEDVLKALEGLILERDRYRESVWPKHVFEQYIRTLDERDKLQEDVEKLTDAMREVRQKIVDSRNASDEAFRLTGEAIVAAMWENISEEYEQTDNVKERYERKDTL